MAGYNGAYAGAEIDAGIAKIQGVEAGAQVNPTASEIKTSYESNPNTNAFTDAEQTKLAGIESNATADQTASEIKTLYESNANTNAYTDAEVSKLAGIEAGAEVNNIIDLNATDLTDGGESTLHYHASDRDRANHTGTQTASTISDFDTEVSNNTDVLANTTARHDAVTVLDTNTLDLTLTGQQVQGDVLGVKDTNASTGVTFVEFYTCTQAEYDAIGVKDTNTLYIITT